MHSGKVFALHAANIGQTLSWNPDIPYGPRSLLGVTSELRASAAGVNPLPKKELMGFLLNFQ